MSLTPSTSKMINPVWGSRLTPSNSPFTKNISVKSPTKSNRQELGLSLKQVIGTTANSANAFDILPSARCFAFTAGAAAVIATIDDAFQVSQRFFRARPTAAPLNPTASIYDGPSTPSNGAVDSRNRTAASLREAGIGVASPGGEWADSPGSKSWTTRERVKAATCVSFSPDGKYLAVGETGYRPRVLIFSTSVEAPSDIPVTCLTDHTFGVRAVAFSPDSQYLATLGSANDGFLYVWSINGRTGSATLHASNKCTSHINRIAWLGSNLVTVGVRHVKIWRMDDPDFLSPKRSRQSDVSSIFAGSIHKTLPGRNCLLGSLIEATFTCLVPIAPDKAIVSTDRGDLCLLDDSEGSQRFAKIASAGFGVTAMVADSKGRIHVGGVQGQILTLAANELLTIQTPPPSPTPHVCTAAVLSARSSARIEAMGSLPNCVVTIDSNHSIQLLSQAFEDDLRLSNVIQRLPAHGDAVLGVRALSSPNSLDASFLTWAADGTVLFWNHDGVCRGSLQVELEQLGSVEEINEARVVQPSSGVEYLVTGDKYGVLRFIDVTTETSFFDFRAHAGEITDIAIHEGKSIYVASSGRDRTVQVFRKRLDSWELLQTLDEHVGAVTSVLFSPSGHRLISSSSDRTLVVRECVSREVDNQQMTAYLILRTITLKSTPASMALASDQEDTLLLSTIDRYLHRYDLRTGQSVSSFKPSDTDGGDAVVLSSLVHVHSPTGASLIAAVSSTDKSIRLYDENGSLFGRDWGHTEGISDIALITSAVDTDRPAQKYLVTVAVDGTIFVWDTSRTPPRHDMSRSMDLTSITPTSKELLVSKPPLRRVLSQSELARFQRSPTEEVSSPSGSRSPLLRKTKSKLSLAQPPKLDPSPLPSPRPHTSAEGASRKANRNRSPSPPSPRTSRTSKPRRPSLDVSSRAHSVDKISTFGSLTNSTEQVCRTLRAYRKKLANSSENLTPATMRELERELGLTARTVGEKATQAKGLDDNVMVKLLDQYSERLVEMLGEKIAATVAKQVRQNSEVCTPSRLGSVAMGGEKGAEEIGDENIPNTGPITAGAEN